MTNLSIDLLRKRRPAISVSAGPDEEDEALELPDARDERPSDLLEASETAGEVRDCLAALAPHFQSVLVLRELEGLSYQEISQVLGVKIGTVESRLARARKELRERLTDYAVSD